MLTEFGRDGSIVGQQIHGVGAEMTQTGQSLSETSTAISDTSESLSEIGETLTDTGRQATAAGENLSEAGDQAQKTGDKFSETGDKVKKSGDKVADLGKKFTDTGNKIKGVGENLTSIGGTLTRNVTLPLAGAGAAAIKVAADFDSGMSKVQAISGATGEDLDKLRDKAREMGSKTKFSASEAADAMSYMAMAGWKTGDMLDGIEGIMNLAAASGEDLATTSDIVTDALTAFGLKAKDSGHFSDILAAASSNANTKVSGISAEDTAEAVGLMANAGIKGSQAGTSLRSILTRLATDAGASSKSLGALGVLTKELGVDFYDANGKVRDFGDILNDARKQWKTLSEEDASRFAKKIAGEEGISAWLSMMNAAPEDIAKLSGAISNCDGAAEKMAATMQNNLKGQLTVLKSQAEELAIGFGTQLMPVAQDLVGLASSAMQGFSGLNDGTKKLIIYAGLAAAAMGPLTTGIGSVVTAGGKLVSTVGTMATAFSTAGGGIAGVGSALTAVIGPAGLALLAIGGVAAVGIALYKDLHRGSEALDEFNKKMEEAKDSAGEIDEITESLKNLEEARLSNYSTQSEEINSVENLRKKLKDLVDKNGKLIGSKEELKNVVKQLNEKGFIVELNKTGTLITNYKTLIGEIDNYVQQKKAQTMLDSLEPEYQNALKEKARYYSIYVKNLAEMNELQKKLNDDEYLAGLSVKEYKALCDTYNQLAENASNAFSQYQSSCEVIDAYDKSMAAIAKGDYETATTILSGYYEDLGSVMKKKGDYAKEEQEKAITELSSQFIQQIQAYGAAMQTGNEAVISDAKTYLEQAAGELEKAGLKLPEGFIQGVESGSIGAEEAVATISKLPKEAAEKAAQESDAAIETLSNEFAVQMQNYGEAVKNGMNDQSEQILAQISTTALSLREHGVELPEGFIQGIKDGSIGAEEAINTVNDLCDKIVNEVKMLPNGMSLEAVNACLQMAATFEAEGKAVPQETAEMAEKILAEFDDLPDDAKEQIKNTCAGMLNELEAANPELYAAAEANGDSYISAFKRKMGIASPSKVMQEMGNNTIEGLILGMNAKKDSAVSTITGIMQSMVTAAGSVSFTGIGGNVVSGILSGLNDKAPSLMSRARSLATGIAGVIGGALRINSPSKVMIPMGQAVAEGMEVGLLNGAGSLYETASAISLETAEALGGISSRGLNYASAHSMNYGDRLDRLLDAVERLADSQTTMEIDGRPFGRLVREYV